MLGEAAQTLGRTRFGVNVESILPRDLQKDATKLQGTLLDRAVEVDAKNPDLRQQRIEWTRQQASFEGRPATEAWSKVKADLGWMSGDLRYYALTRSVNVAASAATAEEAPTLAKELLVPGDDRIPDWNHDNALDAGTSVPGRVALRNGMLRGQRVIGSGPPSPSRQLLRNSVRLDPTWHWLWIH